LGSFYGSPAPTARSTFFGNPDFSHADAKVDRLYAIAEHNTEFGLSVRSHTSWVNYDKFYQNVYPGTPLNAPGKGLVGIPAYNNETDRENLFNQTDFTYRLDLGLVRHTFLFSAEFGHQKSDNWRHNGELGPDNGHCVSFSTANGSPRGQCNVLFSQPTIFNPGVNFAATQSKSHVEADVRSFYAQDQMQITRYVEVVAGVRHDTFGLDFTNLGLSTPTLPANAQLSRTDQLISPRAGLLLKPTDYLSMYGSYSVSYLPASGDQFNGVAINTVTLDPEKYTNYEVGAKWDVAPALAITAALYRTDRENIRFATSPTTFVQTGQSQVEGLEIALTGYVTDKWQVTGGYSHIFKGELTSATSTTLPAGTPCPFSPKIPSLSGVGTSSRPFLRPVWA
jgi:catecholate siderophore receptor